MLRKLWGEYKSYIIAFIAITALVGIMWIFSIPCPIKHITGLSCAGCGMSRAMLAALALDFGTAFTYHPLWVVIIPAILAIVILSAKGKSKTAVAIFCCLMVAMITVWVIRLIAKDSIVAFDLENGRIYKLIDKILHR